MRTLS
jgi:Sodium:sulfate symporter transmembrane region